MPGFESSGLFFYLLSLPLDISVKYSDSEQNFTIGELKCLRTRTDIQGKLY